MLHGGITSVSGAAPKTVMQKEWQTAQTERASLHRTLATFVWPCREGRHQAYRVLWWEVGATAQRPSNRQQRNACGESW